MKHRFIAKWKGRRPKESEVAGLFGRELERCGFSPDRTVGSLTVVWDSGRKTFFAQFETVEEQVKA